MKGIILAGGMGSRMYPCTAVINKHLLPVFNKPMVYYPIETLTKAGIREIMVVTGKESIEQFKKLLNPHYFPEINFEFGVQKEAGGIAQALGLGQAFAQEQKIAMILGDNIFASDISNDVSDYENNGSGAKILLKSVSRPELFTVAKIENQKITGFEDRPFSAKSDLAVTGLSFYDKQVWQVIPSLQPSLRGELELIDVNNYYLRNNQLSYGLLEGDWFDVDNYTELLRASIWAESKLK
ncbi:MAG: sugar phosphate nucleotidyltransferase [Candidatus Parcubacteria bacterium]|nr:sugar phosphate nucleotidyltransferase [Candidatus Parcubacteria bacterium]